MTEADKENPNSSLRAEERLIALTRAIDAHRFGISPYGESLTETAEQIDSYLRTGKVTPKYPASEGEDRKESEETADGSLR